MKSNAIWTRARADLTVTTEQGDPDPYLWEHAVRVARNARWIISLDVVRKNNPDPMAIEAAALYHDSGWIARLKDGEVKREDFLIRPTLSAHFEQGAMMLEQRMMDLLPPETLVRASQAIRSLDDRDTSHAEGRVLSEADSLDEFGILSLWGNIRRGMLEGRGVQSAIDTWRRRKEYRFWEARLSDSFHLAPVRAVAEKRLQHYERLMQELAILAEGKDINVEQAPVDLDRISRRVKH